MGSDQAVEISKRGTGFPQHRPEPATHDRGLDDDITTQECSPSDGIFHENQDHTPYTMEI